MQADCGKSQIYRNTIIKKKVGQALPDNLINIKQFIFRALKRTLLALPLYPFTPVILNLFQDLAIIHPCIKLIKPSPAFVGNQRFLQLLPLPEVEGKVVGQALPDSLKVGKTSVYRISMRTT